MENMPFFKIHSSYYSLKIECKNLFMIHSAEKAKYRVKLDNKCILQNTCVTAV